jgi:hypothetical protein
MGTCWPTPEPGAIPVGGRLFCLYGEGQLDGNVSYLLANQQA